MSKKYNEPIRAWGREDRPESFVWRGKLYRINKLLQIWSVEQKLLQKPESKFHAVVEATCPSGEGVYELYYERLQKQWYLARVVD